MLDPSARSSSLVRSLKTTPEQLRLPPVRCQLVINITDTFVVEAVSEPVLIAVVNPLRHPDDGLGLGVLRLVLHLRELLPRLAGDELLELSVELCQVAVCRSAAAVPERGVTKLSSPSISHLALSFRAIPVPPPVSWFTSISGVLRAIRLALFLVSNLGAMVRQDTGRR